MGAGNDFESGNNSGSDGSFDWGRLFASLMSGYASYQNAREGQRAAEAAKNPEPSYMYRTPYMNELLSQIMPYIMSEAGNIYQRRGEYTGYTPESSGLQRIQELLAPYVSGQRSTNGVGGAGGSGGAFGGGLMPGWEGVRDRDPNAPQYDILPGQAGESVRLGTTGQTPYGGGVSLDDVRGRDSGVDLFDRGGSGRTEFGNELMDTNDPREMEAREVARMLMSGGRLTAGAITGMGDMYAMAKPILNRIANRTNAQEGNQKNPRWGQRMEDYLTNVLSRYQQNALEGETNREIERLNSGVRVPMGDTSGQDVPPRVDVEVSPRMQAFIRSLPPDQQAQFISNMRMAGTNRYNEGQMFSGMGQNAFFGLGGPMSMMVNDGGGGAMRGRASQGDDYRFGGTGGGFSAY